VKMVLSCEHGLRVAVSGASGKVVKALRGGVQDVAVKQLLHTNAAAVEKFLEVSCLCQNRSTAARPLHIVKCRTRWR
jgi:hypothetical protein